MNNQYNTKEALVYMNELTEHYIANRIEFDKNNGNYFTHLGTSLTPEKADILIQSLAKCQCCPRHTKDKSVTFNHCDLAQVYDIEPKCFLNDNCRCPCRHYGRMINLAHYYIINKFD